MGILRMKQELDEEKIREKFAKKRESKTQGKFGKNNTKDMFA